MKSLSSADSRARGSIPNSARASTATAVRWASQSAQQPRVQPAMAAAFDAVGQQDVLDAVALTAGEHSGQGPRA